MSLVRIRWLIVARSHVYIYLSKNNTTLNSRKRPFQVEKTYCVKIKLLFSLSIFLMLFVYIQKAFSLSKKKSSSSNRLPGLPWIKMILIELFIQNVPNLRPEPIRIWYYWSFHSEIVRSIMKMALYQLRKLISRWASWFGFFLN